MRRVHSGKGLGVLALGLVLLEFLPAPYPMSSPDTPLWYKAVGEDARGGAILNLPVNWDRPGYLLYQTEHGKPLTSAYISRDDPRTLVERAPVLQHLRHLGRDIIWIDLKAQGQQVLADLDVRWVVLDRYQMPSGEEREITDAMAAQIFAGQPPVYEDERLTVYEVTDSEGSTPYIMLGTGWGPLDEIAQSRRFVGQATVLVVSEEATTVTVEVTPAEGGGEPYAIRIPVQPGENSLTLEAHSEKPASIAGLRLIAGEN